MPKRKRTIKELLKLIRKHNNAPWTFSDFGRITLDRPDWVLLDFLQYIAKFEGLDVSRLGPYQIAGNLSYCQRIGNLLNITPSLAHGVLIATNIPGWDMRNLLGAKFRTEFPFTEGRVAKIRQLRRYILAMLDMKEMKKPKTLFTDGR